LVQASERKCVIAEAGKADCRLRNSTYTSNKGSSKHHRQKHNVMIDQGIQNASFSSCSILSLKTQMSKTGISHCCRCLSIAGVIQRHIAEGYFWASLHLTCEHYELRVVPQHPPNMALDALQAPHASGAAYRAELLSPLSVCSTLLLNWSLLGVQNHFEELSWRFTELILLHLLLLLQLKT